MNNFSQMFFSSKNQRYKFSLGYSGRKIIYFVDEFSPFYFLNHFVMTCVDSNLSLSVYGELLSENMYKEQVI